jgi:cob(I)alamin adenosyltransferase
MTEPMKYYTATGDDGTTGLLGEGRVKKYHARPEACGTVDEAQAALGMSRAVMQDQEAALILLEVQRDLYHLMAEIASTKESAAQFRLVDSERVEWLEGVIDTYSARIEIPKEFTLSGATVSGAALDVARTVVRRAERLSVRLLDDGLIENRDLIRYLNRLSTLCFVFSRHEDALGGAEKITLAKQAGSKKKAAKSAD